jgi:serine/threonine protein kinase
MFRQIVDGIRYIHKTGIIHSDIKHDNIMIQKDTNTPIIIDLGSGIEANNNVQSQSVFIRELTYIWSSPEYVQFDTPYFKSDVWSLGCLLYFMVTGFNPWDPKTRISYCNSMKIYFHEK